MVSASDRRPHLDGIRTIAVLAVIAAHSLDTRDSNSHFFDVLSPGPAGVRLFFVLSGFLITGILLKARAEAVANQVSLLQVWKAFYARRALRIFPLAYLVLALALLAGDPIVRADVWWYVAYLANIKNAVTHLQEYSSLSHYWSLAIEEQFYLLWPAVVLLVAESWLGAVIGFGIAVSVGLRMWLIAHGELAAAYSLLPTRMDALLAGALFAWGERRAWSLRSASVGCLSAACLLGALGATMLSETIGILISLAVVLSASLGWRGLAGRVIGSRPIVWLGTISYGIYVYHYFVAFTVHALELRYNVWLRYPIAFGWPRFAWMVETTIPVAAASWYLFEKPINDLKRFVPYVTRPGTLPRTLDIARTRHTARPDVAPLQQ